MSVVCTASADGRSSASAGLLACALADLDVDLGELLRLCDSAQERLSRLEAELPGACPYETTRELLRLSVISSRRRYRAVARRIRWLRVDARRAAPSRSLVQRLTAQRAAFADRLRAEQALLAALPAAADWQSPSFAHSLVPTAGRHTGRIRAHCNDYKRDRHLDGEAYEDRYLETMTAAPNGLRALLTGCGMAALTTIVAFLMLERKLCAPVIAGAGIYHETRLLLERALPGRMKFVDEGDTRAVLRAIDELHPSAVFLDSLSNTKWMPVPELGPVIERLRGTDTYLIIDNTGLSVACQPFALADRSVRLLVFESLLKYAQLGLDRVNAGLIIARAEDGALIDQYREHLGTNIADVAVHALPWPDRQALERRLRRLERNALFLAQHLAARAPAGVSILYPGLRSHPCARVGASLAFRGSCLSVIFGDRDRRLVCERALVQAAVAEAKTRGVQLLAGSSFGFDTTRIYLTAATAACGEPFVRIAAGTEDRLALEVLAEALAGAIRAVSPK